MFRLIRDERVRWLCAAPTVLISLANAPVQARGEVPPGVHVVTAGAPPAAATIERLEGEFGWEVTHVYGLTETAPFITVCAPLPEHERLGPRRPGGGEVPAGGRADHIRRAAGGGRGQRSEVPADGQTLGEIVVRGNVVMGGYYNDPEATERAMGDGWFHSGDAAVVHPDGYVEIRDRIKDVIISGGENISSIEVEGALLRHPAVHEVAVVGMPHEKWGETPHAFVVLREGASATADELIAFARGPAGALQGAAPGHFRRPSCRRPRPARSRSSCCAPAPPTSPGNRPLLIRPGARMRCGWRPPSLPGPPRPPLR